ncbi:hypothetical protein QJQ45_026572, partial [Haematococcus lacustris]
ASVVLQPATSTCGMPSSWDTWPSPDFTYLLLTDVARPRLLTLETCPPEGMGWDTVLRVVQAEPGKCGQRAIWAVEDDDGSPWGAGCSRLTFTAAAGLHYFIVVEGFRQSDCGSPALMVTNGLASNNGSTTGRRLILQTRPPLPPSPAPQPPLPALGTCGNPQRLVRLFA